MGVGFRLLWYRVVWRRRPKLRQLRESDVFLVRPSNTSWWRVQECSRGASRCKPGLRHWSQPSLWVAVCQKSVNGATSNHGCCDAASSPGFSPCISFALDCRKGVPSIARPQDRRSHGHGARPTKRSRSSHFDPPQCVSPMFYGTSCHRATMRRMTKAFKANPSGRLETTLDAS